MPTTLFVLVCFVTGSHSFAQVASDHDPLMYISPQHFFLRMHVSELQIH
jgi:hypothetical protein